MLRRIIIFLIRKKLGLKEYEGFQFVNQKSPDTIYFFTEKGLIKSLGNARSCMSNVSLNWLLDEKCEIDNSPMYTDEILKRHMMWLASKGVGIHRENMQG